MARLEISIINFKALNAEHRYEAEYFSKQNLHMFETLYSMKYRLIGDFCDVTDGIHTSIDYDDESPVRLISATSPRENYFDLSRNARISEKAHESNPRTALRLHDVILSTVGTIGNCAVVDERILPANSDRHVGIIRVNQDYSPYVVSTYLLSKYGRMQTFRETTGNVQPNLFLYKIREIVIPEFGDGLQKKVEKIAVEALEKRNNAQLKYLEAEDMLLDELEMKDWQPEKGSISIRSFKDIKAAARIDAEYYQHKYDELFEKLNGYDCRPLGKIVTVKKSIEPGSEAYQESGVPFYRVSNISKEGLTETDIFLDENKYFSEELAPKKDTILFSKDGSIGIAYKVEEDMKAITSGALLHLTVTDSDVMPDYLTLVLNSPVVKLQAEREAGGSIIQHWKPDEIEKVIIPVIDRFIQERITVLVQESFSLRKDSRQLLESAKRAIEAAIEQGEETAIKLLG